ncbi:MAG: hypothetical protein ACYDCP_07150 [Thermoplasmataceae archaeon]
MALGWPTIQGLDYGFSSLVVNADPIPFPIIGLKDVSRSQNLKPGNARGVSAQIQSRSRGVYEAKLSLTFYKSAYVGFLKLIAAAAANQGLGYLEAEFDFTLSYEELAPGLTSDYALGCRLVGDSEQHSEEGGVLVTKIELEPKQLNIAGLSPLALSLFPAIPGS